MEVQIFGTAKCRDTRAAQRFFKERRVKIHMMDLKERAASPGELRRFIQKFGVDPLVDRQSKRFAELGLASAHRSDAWWMETLAAEPLLLRTPLVRWKEKLTVGPDEVTWREWVKTVR